MSLYFKEYLNAKMSTSSEFKNQIHLVENLNSNTPFGQEGSVIAEIEGLHNVQTGNFTLYTEKAMLSSIDSWTYPYQKALIKHHDEEDGEVIGRIKNAQVVDSEVLKGSKALLLTAEVLEEENKKATLDGRNKTVSVGVVGHDVTCSICGEQLAEGNFCEHDRGEEYDGSICYWIIHKMTAKELSFVNVPSDHYAQVIKAYKVTEKGGVSTDMKEGKDINIKESQDKDIKVTNNIKNDDMKKEGEKDQKAEDIVLESKRKLIKKLNKEKDQLKEVIKEKDKEMQTTLEKLQDLKDKIVDLQTNIVNKDKQIQKEVAMRESLEEELSKNKGVIKEGLIKKISNLREKHLGLETNFEHFSERSLDSLQDTIIDLQEQIDNSVDQQIGSVKQDGLVDDDKDIELKEKAKDVKKKTIEKEKEDKKRALNLSEALDSLF